jgi:uncharacterized protein (DUF983 family)
MENATLSAATWFWLMVPMPLVVVLSLLNLLIKKGRTK